MGRTPDRRPGEADEEGIVFENRPAGQDPPLSGGFRYVTGSFRLRDKLGVFDPRNPSGGADYEVQFALSGSLTGSAIFSFNPDTNTLVVPSLSGSLTTLADGTSYLVAGNNVTITSGSSGSVRIDSIVNTSTSVVIPFYDAIVVDIEHAVGVNVYDIEVFDVDHNKIIPKSATAISSTHSRITFGSPTSGYVLLGSVGNPSPSSIIVPFFDVTTFEIDHAMGVTVYDIEVFDPNHNKIIPKSVTALTPTHAVITFGSITSGYVLIGAAGTPSIRAGLGLIKSASLDVSEFIIDDSIVATVSGTTFTGAVIFDAGLSGSLTTLADGTSYMVAGENIVITTGSNGSVQIASALSTASTASFQGVTSVTVNHVLGVTLYDIEVFDTNHSKIIPKSATASTSTSSVITFGAPTSGYVMVGSPGGARSSGFPDTYSESFTGDGSKNVFDLVMNTDDSKVFVFVDGSYRHPGEDYTVVGNQLTLISTPSSGQKIRIRHLTLTN
jgi:hypothetical protein